LRPDLEGRDQARTTGSVVEGLPGPLVRQPPEGAGATTAARRWIAEIFDGTPCATVGRGRAGHDIKVPGQLNVPRAFGRMFLDLSTYS
jgi:hypothetical protein